MPRLIGPVSLEAEIVDTVAVPSISLKTNIAALLF
jgi:hypothetical protein